MTKEELEKAIEQLRQLRKNEKNIEAEIHGKAIIQEPLLKEYLELQVHALVLLNDALRGLGKSNEGLIYVRQAYDLTVDGERKELHAEVLRSCGLTYLNLLDTAKAQEYFEEALQISEELGNRNGIAANLHNLGALSARLSDNTTALIYLQKAAVINEETNNIHWLANNLFVMGNVYWNLSDFPRALDNYSGALNTFQQLGYKRSVAGITENIALVYMDMANYTLALEYHTKAKELYEEVGDKAGVAMVCGNIGMVYLNLSEYDKALEYDYMELAGFKELGMEAEVARVLGNIGSTYIKISDYNRALEYLSKALETHEKSGAKKFAANVTLSIAKVYAAEKFYSYDAVRAKTLLTRALTAFESLGAKKELYGCHYEYSKLLKQESLFEEALHHHEKYHVLEKEVQSEEATRKGQLMENRRKVDEAERDRQVKLARFREQEKILHNILPSQIAERILDGEKTIADRLDSVSVFFSDIVGFTRVSQDVSPEELVNMLNSIFGEFDRIARKHGLEKIKTIGDAYMAVAGAPIPQTDHAERAALFAIEVMQAMHDYRLRTGNLLEIRIGLHSGHVVAGIIGENKFSYDLWGDAVNTASRMESHGETGKIQVSEDFVKALQGSKFNFTERGEIDVKGKGLMKTYFLTG